MASWAVGQPEHETNASAIEQLWTEIEEQTDEPVVLELFAAGAIISAVVGEPTGTVLGYLPPGYEHTGLGSLHSVGNPAAAERDDREPSVTAYFFGHYSEFPRWQVIPHADGRQALAEFCEQPLEPPSTIVWDID